MVDQTREYDEVDLSMLHDLSCGMSIKASAARHGLRTETATQRVRRIRAADEAYDSDPNCAFFWRRYP